MIPAASGAAIAIDPAALPPKRRLAVFDIDGTLTDTVALHQAAVVRVLQGYGFPALNTDLGSYRHHTDEGVFQEAFQTGRGRAPNEAERAAFQAAFEAAFAAACRTVATIPGAASLLRYLLHETDWAVAFATGSYRGATLIKLRGAGLPFAEAVVATSSESITRADIVLCAIAGARDHYGVDQFDRVVALGDGKWDVLAARDLALPFLGVGTGPSAPVLAGLGVQVVPDLSDPASVVARLATVAIPAHAT